MRLLKLENKSEYPEANLFLASPLMVSTGSSNESMSLAEYIRFVKTTANKVRNCLREATSRVEDLTTKDAEDSKALEETTQAIYDLGDKRVAIEDALAEAGRRYERQNESLKETQLDLALAKEEMETLRNHDVFRAEANLKEMATLVSR